jgi:hypothetical protein
VRKNMGISYDLIKSFNYPHRKPHDLIWLNPHVIYWLVVQ